MVLLGRIAVYYVCRCGLLLPTEQRDMSVGLSVCLSVGLSHYYALPPGEYDWTTRLWRRCGLMSGYFDHLLL